MAAVGHQEAPIQLSPDVCRRYFHARGDVSLGLLPQLLLDEPRAELWAYFWYAARHADDAIESGKADAADLRRRIASPRDDAPADQALQRFLAQLPATLPRASVAPLLEDALAALARERAWTTPPPLREYVATVAAKAGVPLYILHRLMMPHEDDANVRRMSHLLALSIQLGDDARDLDRDRRQGLQTVAAEEAALAAAEFPGETDPVAQALPGWREAASRWYAFQALESTERLTDLELRAQARTGVLLWLKAIESGQLRERSHPLRWPAPLGDLLGGGTPTAARMAAARRVLRNDPSIVSVASRWDARRRMEALKEIRKTMPPLYLEMGNHLRVAADTRA